MAARAAARAGAGLTTIAVSMEALPVYAAALTSVMVSPVVAPADFDRLFADSRYSGLLIGPGAGVGPTTRARVQAMLRTGRPTVLDADALTSFEDDPDTLFRAIVGPCVLTPHDGEFARLFDVSGDKLTRSRAAARRSKAVVVLKGSDTIIASPDGRVIVNANAPPTLATAGAGDVLSGVVLGLLAQGMDPFLAAAAAVWLHGAAATAFGPGLLASRHGELRSADRQGDLMQAMVLNKIGTPLEWTELADRQPGPLQIRVKVGACGVCRTDLHVVDGELPQPQVPIIPGHEIVGRIDAIGAGVEHLQIGERVGIPWLGHTCGTCPYCVMQRENLRDRPLFTGYTRDGGFATATVADARFAFPLGEAGTDESMAPLLCAGLIG